MTDPLPLFPTTVIGSMPRPQYLKDLLRAGSRTGEHDAVWQRRMDDAVRYVIGMQERAGIDIISDGEWRRESYVDVRFPEIDTPEQIVARVQKALAHVAPERITLNPDCGFAPGKDHDIPLEEAYAKLKNQVLAAKRLRELYGALNR